MNGFCACGCGQITPVAKRNRKHLGHVKGQHLPFVNGHNRRGERKREWVQRECGFTSPCWIWLGYAQDNGYGKATGDSGQTSYAHRVVYEALKGPIPTGLDLDHLCRQRACVNPDHLEPVTRSENLKRGVGVGGNRRKLHV